MAELNLRALLTASQAALYTGVTPAAVCNWVSRGFLKPAADRQGRVIAAEGEVARSQRGRPRKSAA